jgi:hypothetical protein
MEEAMEDVVDPSVEVLDHDFQTMEILPRVKVEVELYLRAMACQNPDMQLGQDEENEASLEENSTGNYMDYKNVADWEKILVVHRLSPVDIQ